MLIRMAGTAPMEALRTAIKVDDLCFAERFSLWTFRVWIRATTLNDDPPPLLANAYRQIGASHALSAISETMEILKSFGVRSLATGYPCENTLTDDEIRLLQVLACCQNGVVPATRPVLTSLLNPTAAMAALDPLTDWADILAEVGMTLPIRDWNLPELRGPMTVPGNRAEAALLH